MNETKTPEKPSRRDAFMDVVDPSSSTLLKSGPKRALTSTEIRETNKASEKQDPIAGKRVKKSTLVPMTVYLPETLAKQIKVLAAMEGNRINHYLSEAVEQYAKGMAHKLPDL